MQALTKDVEASVWKIVGSPDQNAASFFITLTWYLIILESAGRIFRIAEEGQSIPHKNRRMPNLLFKRGQLLISILVFVLKDQK